MNDGKFGDIADFFKNGHQTAEFFRNISVKREIDTNCDKNVTFLMYGLLQYIYL